jgi:hypothetical protein
VESESGWNVNLRLQGFYFDSAIGIAARKRKITLTADVAIDAEADLNLSEDGYFVGARVNVSLPGVEHGFAQDLGDEAHQICHYSRTTRGNVEVAFNVMSARPTFVRTRRSALRSILIRRWCCH